MRAKLIIAAFCLVVAAAFVFTPAPASTTAAPAVVIHPPDGLCGLFDGDGGFVITTNTMIVDSNNGKNGMLRCQVSGVANSTGSAVVYNFGNTGAMCGIFLPATGFVFTQNWNETVSASGNATLRCHAN